MLQFCTLGFCLAGLYILPVSAVIFFKALLVECCNVGKFGYSFCVCFILCSIVACYISADSRFGP